MRYARAAAIAVVWSVAMAVPNPAAAQHAHHGIPAGSASVELTGAAHCAEGTPLHGAIVQLLHESGGERHLLATTVTDGAGRFALRAGVGTYVLEILSLGHAPHRRQVSIAGPAVSVGTVRLAFLPPVLDAVTARAEPDAVQLRSGAVVVDTRRSAAAGGSIADVLRTVPGLDLDGAGRIAMRGSPGVLVLMNGRRIPLAGDALAAFLRQMPATALERIEAGTTASARQDADGAAGVVNLVFRDDAMRRTATRSVAGSVATEGHYAGTAGAAGDLGDVLRWDATYSLSGMEPRTDSRTARWSLVPSDAVLHTGQESRATAEHRLHSLMGGAAVVPGPGTSLAVRGAYSRMEGAYRSVSASSNTDSAGTTRTRSTSSLLAHAIPSGEIGAVASVDRGVARFTAEARSSVVSEDFRGAYVNSGGYHFMTAVMASRQRLNVLQSDLSFRLRGTIVDVGHKSQFRVVTARYDGSRYGDTISRPFRYEADVHAGYVTATRSIGTVRAEAGLRLEADRTRFAEEGAAMRSALRLFPSIGGRWTDPRRHVTYRVAYARRIDRPATEMLNPLAMGEDDMSESIGNPWLVPEISDQVEVGVERPGALLSLQLTPFIRWTRDPIRQRKTVRDMGHSTVTFENLVRARATGADGSVRARLPRGTVMTLAGSVAHMATTSHLPAGSGVYGTARLTLDLPVTGNTTAQLYAYRRGAEPIEQGEILPAFTSQLALTQRIARDRGRLTLRLDDPWRGDRVEFRTGDATFTQVSRRRTARPLLSLFASYAVGGRPRDDAPARTERSPRLF